MLSALTLTIIATYSHAQQPQKLGKLTSAALTEVSGMIPSQRQAGNFWVHNDSGDQSAIYLINQQAQLTATALLEGVQLRDAEDIAKLSIAGTPYLLLADMGNNLRNRDTLSLYLFEEPLISANRSDYRIPSEKIREIKFRYSDKKRDAEALFVDPVDNAVYIISKRDFKSTIFKLSAADIDKDIVHQLSPQLELPFTFATAADSSPSGSHILVKNLSHVYLWERKEGESVINSMKRPYKSIPYAVEPQGEAICFDRDGPYFYTISERPLGLDSYLYKYEY